MKALEARPLRWIRVIAGFAILFGLLTLISGGSTLFTAEARREAGNYVGFVLWFNFVAGFAYVIAGIGLWRWQRWAMWLSFAIAAASLLVFASFGLHIWRGGSYEMRTMAAMSLRTVVWLMISTAAVRLFGPSEVST